VPPQWDEDHLPAAAISPRSPIRASILPDQSEQVGRMLTIEETRQLFERLRRRG